MARISPILSSGTRSAPDPLLLTRINGWINDLYSIPYAYCQHWNTPAEVQSASFADCKGKAVALYANMKWHGATNVRIVIGRRHVGDLKTHAWLEWQTSSGKYLLDPTFNEMAPERSWTDPSTYIPFYAYDGVRKYRADNHRASSPVAVAQNVVVANYATDYRSAYWGSPSWATAQSFNRSADYARAQIRRPAQMQVQKKFREVHQSSNRNVASTQPNQVQHAVSSPASQRTRVAGWKHLSAPNALQPN